MAKTVVGLFDGRAAARRAVEELLDEGFLREEIGVMSKPAEPGAAGGAEVAYVEEDGHEQVEDMAKGAGAGAAIGGAAGLFLSLAALSVPVIGPVLAAGPLAGLLAGAGLGGTVGGLISGLTRLGVPAEDADTLAEGVRRGGTLVSVNAGDEMADRAVAVMRRNGAAEIDKRAAQWREEGWTGFDAREAFQAYEGGRMTMPGGGDAPNEASDVTAEHEPVTPRAAARPGEVALPVVEEHLEVGKREVERGGVRVHRRVSETPVEEEVELREERVHVERRPVDYTFHGAESEAFKEGMVEIREAYEELIVNKKARVVEEVVVGKDVEQHTETVRETVRRTDVEVERLGPGGAPAPGEDETAGGTRRGPEDI